ncbi:LysM peptidoglycan-binding domain-containing protein [Micrococcus sp. ACRRV]|uniref:LysM peptidoglycan-binding domain-containing protein n=1 Tax=Micrococcus sp. ACRRV TaxID=2918203 RepID=UPI001EF16CB3|nr:LysM peptidoglycan-binding domain-containing protein [Micrococcus sp. ACRRV]MCG7422698.1 LysM peptidoglycan-binding domain-containing protein [Micrococcus sp. ACRRV]
MTAVTAVLSRTHQLTSVRARPTRAVATSTRAAARTSGVRLTRRGRLLFRGLPVILSVAAATVAAAFFAGVLFSPPAVSADTPAEELQTVTVMPGDSLWTIARDVAPEADRRDTMRRIDELNGLEGRDPELGQELYVPPTR